MTHSFAGLEAVFRLGRDGAWNRLSSSDVHASMETTLETFASLCELELEPGHEVVVEYDGGTVLARCTPQAVVIAVAEGKARPNKLVMRAAMKRVEVRSRAASNGTQPQTPIESGARPGLVTSQSEQPASAPSSGGPPNNTHSDAPSIDFDIVFDHEPVRSAAEQSPNTTPKVAWSGLAQFLREALKASTSIVGRTVACNYWRQALRTEELEHDIDVDFRGRVDPRSPADPVPTKQWLAFERAHQDWLERVQQISESFDFPLDNIPRGARVSQRE